MLRLMTLLILAGLIPGTMFRMIEEKPIKLEPIFATEQPTEDPLFGVKEPSKWGSSSSTDKPIELEPMPTEEPVSPERPDLGNETLIVPEKPVAIGLPPKPMDSNTLTPYQYCWTEWFDMDDPITGPGDYELLPALRLKYPGKICENPLSIEARTLSGLTPAAAGDVVMMDKNMGFVCNTEAQPDKCCSDYRVRFICPRPYCAEEVCWTRWFDIDDPPGWGDYEMLSSLHKMYPGRICRKPKYIEVVTVMGNIPALETGQKFIIFSPTEGFACRNDKCQRCKDYKVRFGCCCRDKALYDSWTYKPASVK